jgi:hypothetical protein
MDELIAVFRQNEQGLTVKGASGFESAPYTGDMGGGHSLGCTFQELAVTTGLDYEERADGIHLRREPRSLECRAYGISDGLVKLMETNRSAGRLHVDVDPLVSALIDATKIYFWSIMVPTGPNSSEGKFRCDKVFRHLPELRVILAITTPEEHAEAEKRLKASGLWVDATGQ